MNAATTTPTMTERAARALLDVEYYATRADEYLSALQEALGKAATVEGVAWPLARVQAVRLVLGATVTTLRGPIGEAYRLSETWEAPF